MWRKLDLIEQCLKFLWKNLSRSPAFVNALIVTSRASSHCSAIRYRRRETQLLNFHAIHATINALASDKFTRAHSSDVYLALADKLTASRRLSRRSPRLGKRTMANGCSSSVASQPIPRQKSHGFTMGTWSKIRQGTRFVQPRLWASLFRLFRNW